MWAEVGKGQLIGPELVQETTEKIFDRLRIDLRLRVIVRKSYADKRRKPLEFSVGDNPVEILEREFKKLKRSRIAIVKVWWNSKHGPEFTWEREDQMKLKYLLLFINDINWTRSCAGVVAFACVIEDWVAKGLCLRAPAGSHFRWVSDWELRIGFIIGCCGYDYRGCYVDGLHSTWSLCKSPLWAAFWYGERLKGHAHGKRIDYHLCYGGGKIYMQLEPDLPDYIKSLLQNKHFMENIRAYNQMFAMTSFGAKIDESINTGRGPYIFKVSGPVYHWIGSLCPLREKHQDFYSCIYAHNELVKLFRTTRDKCREMDIPEFKIRLYSGEGARGYELPTSNTLGTMGSIAADLKRGTDGNEVRGEVIIYFPRYCLLLSRLAICQNLGNPQFFITFTCNVNWPEIRRYMAQYPQLMTSDQSIYRRRVFLADDSSELRDPSVDLNGYKVVSEMIMHGPCGPANLSAPCIKGDNAYAEVS
ncbi:DNA helicase [Tanacetum coccineum]